MAKSKTLWESSLPKVGIRPTIDGRLGGVRESLEEQMMLGVRTWGNDPEGSTLMLVALPTVHSECFSVETGHSSEIFSKKNGPNANYLYHAVAPFVPVTRGPVFN